MEKNELMLREVNIVDATIISAPSSNKNGTGKRDPEMHKAGKGNQCQFGMKVHIGICDTLGLIRSIGTIVTYRLRSSYLTAQKNVHGTHPELSPVSNVDMAYNCIFPLIISNNLLIINDARPLLK